MFPALPGFVAPSNDQIAVLAQTQLDPDADSGNNAAVPSGFTYFGQFIDHDLILDTALPPTAPVDPTTLKNSRTFRFDLDSVYGGGPSVSPQLYADGKHFKIQAPNPNGVRDLPRNRDGSAILVESRNDENEIISQLHTAFLAYHNKLIDSGLTFAKAQATVIADYQHIVLTEYLPAVLGRAVVDATVNGKGKRFYRPLGNGAPYTPVEFSVAAFRFGHSEVRKTYELNEDTGKVPVFSFTEPDLRGGRQLPAGRQIEWGNFFSQLTDPDDADGINLTRKIDTLISASLFQLPIPGAEATGSNVLAFRNMTRGKFYGLPSGQDVAKAYGVQPLTPATLHLGPGFDTGTPLWYYLLAEAERAEGGLTLGPVGGRLVADVLVKVLDMSQSAGHDYAPGLEIDTMSDLLVAAGVAEEPE
jgi:hypothetical protein